MLSERLLSLISALGIKKTDFAKKIGFSQAYISMVLSGKRTEPSDRFFSAISREFGVNIEWLRDGKDGMFNGYSEDMSSTDLLLVQKYKMLPLDEQKIIDEIVDAMVVRNLSRQKDKI